MKIYTKDYENIWFTADTHYYHKNVLQYCNRPYQNVEEMNEQLVHNYNSVVKERDIVFHLGDFSFGNEDQTRLMYNRLNGHKHLIRGNHDKFRQKFMSDCQYMELKIDEPDCETQLIVMCHYAFRHWNKSHHGSWSIHGHSHGTLPPIGKQHDVGVDNNNYYPVSYQQLKSIMSTREFIAVDHHD